jgi:hypothetical protein
MALSGLLLLALPVRAVDVALTDDAYTAGYSGYLNTNYGAAVSLSVSGLSSGAATNRRAWVRFDLAGALPSGTTWDLVQKATLRVYVNTVTAAGKISIMAATAAWTESTLKQNIAPGTRGFDANNTPYVQQTVSVADKYVTFDVTEVVRDWMDGTVANYGIVLVPGDTVINVQLDSKEATANSHPMALDITLATRRVNPAGDVSMGQFTAGPRP